MSGIEVAGLVLGAFPLVLDGLKELETPIKRMKFYWKFQTKFEIFLADVNKERIVYDQNLDLILAFLDLNPHDEHAFPGGIPDSFWGEPKIAEDLKRKLKHHHFHEFIAELRKMHGALEGLYTLLPIQKVYQTDGQDVDSHMFRLKTSFLGRKDDLLSQLRQSNEWIYKYLDRAARIIPHGTANDQQRFEKHHDKRLKDFQTLQAQARSLYTCFQKSWQCGCSDGHPCGITVQQSKAETNRDHNIMILFNPSASRSTSRTKVRISGARSQQNGKNHACPRESKQHEINWLSQQVSAKSLHGASQEDYIALPELLHSALVLLGGSELLTKDGLQKPAAKLRKGAEKPLPNKSSDSSEVATAASIANRLQNPQSSSGQISTPSARRVRFSTGLHDATIGNVEESEEPISNICESICCETKTPCLGFLQVDDENRLYLHSEPSSQSHQHNPPLTIKSFSMGQKSRFKRLCAGLSTVLLITSIGDTCWLTPSWATSGLFLIGKDEQLDLQPYIVHSSLLKSLQGKAKFCTRPETFYLLGIVILELVFGEEFATATQSFRSAHLGMDGKPNELTEFCTAMEWARMAGGQVGDRLSNGIEWCLGFLLDERKHLSSSECLRETWDRLIAPLEHFLELWVHDPVA
ncbi:hypothetical protein K456DRAFT_1737248 [Colletotrichum gloeosporioides 23]|nr:hypothetical protein K456DRAFT_1737248 [Colletotrichum gloeosporioides 23]